MLPRVTAILLIGIWVFSLFDLIFTTYMSEFYFISEINPIAFQVIESRLLIPFKVGLVSLGSLLLLIHAQQNPKKTGMVALLIFIIHAGLMVYWSYIWIVINGMWTNICTEIPYYM